VIETAKPSATSLGGQYHRNDGSGTEVDCAMIVFCRFDYECHVEIAVRVSPAIQAVETELGRLQAGFPQPRRVAVAPQAKYRKQPHAKYMQSTRQLPGRTLWARDSCTAAK